MMSRFRMTSTSTGKEASMALSDEQIDAAISQHVDPVATYRKLHHFARAIEAELRKQDDALIQHCWMHPAQT
jgi:hypothetical protein